MQLYSFVANITFEESLLHVLSVKRYSFVGIDIKILNNFWLHAFHFIKAINKKKISCLWFYGLNNNQLLNF